MSWLRARFANPRSTLLTTLGLLVLVTVATAAIHSRFNIESGLRARYFGSATWSPPVVAEGIDPRPSTASVAARLERYGQKPFSVEWQGYLEASRKGRYTFATVSDDGSQVWIDDTLVVDNGGDHAPIEARGETTLSAGAHAIRVRFYQNRGGYELTLAWAFESEPLAPMPGGVFETSRPTLAQRLARPVLAVMVPAVLVAWPVVIVVLLGALGWHVWTRIATLVADGRLHPGLVPVLAASLVLNVLGVWWGVPEGWAPDEVAPQIVLGGFAQAFSHGWAGIYPPGYHYALLVSLAPPAAWAWFTGTSLSSNYAFMLVSERLLSVALGTATTLLVYLAASEAASRRAAVFAAMLAATVAPFVYYAKTANVEVGYIFWFALSLVFYLRVLKHDRLRDYLGLAATAAMSVCTKDQAYGLYVLMPLTIVWAAWRRTGAGGGALVRAAVNRKTLLALACFGVVFVLVQNLAFNWTGFAQHVRMITGFSHPYRAFPNTWRGQLDLLWLSVVLIQRSFGWPAFVVCAAGLTYAVVRPFRSGLLLWVLVPAVSYYLTFIAVVGYSYDRFLIPVCLCLAILGGWALDRFVETAPLPRGWRVGTAAGVLAFGVYYAGLVDVAMIFDSRYVVEAWMRQHVAPRQLVGTADISIHTPRLSGFRWVPMLRVETIAKQRPAFVVIDVDYGTGLARSDAARVYKALIDGTLGYRRVLSYRTPLPWLPLAHPDLAGPRLAGEVYSNLYHINPLIEVFERVGTK
jgi:hypothetical protein